jgi:hypothetical protein
MVQSCALDVHIEATLPTFCYKLTVYKILIFFHKQIMITNG